MFIAIEALDAVGKTTLVGELARRLGGTAMSTPGEPLRAYSDEILAALGSDQTARCLFYAASVLAQGRRARDAAKACPVVMDRYWLSTLAYARARGVALDLSSVEAVVPAPDVTVLLTLDEEERMRRLRARGGATFADRESTDPAFREVVLREMRRRDRRSGLSPIEVDVTGANREDAIRRVVSALSARSRAPESPPAGSADASRTQRS